ncbi:hypothetical protein [Ferruginibacter sp. SUN106]|uniref:hypothetical protein n=1 Tax=Ferruginibacter sp. SUN106 TaxID=2978348 RepID=UPI003D3602EA
MDFTQNILFVTGIQNAVIKSSWLQLSFDIVYYVLPLLLLVLSSKRNKWQYPVAIITGLVNLVYALLITSLGMLSVEGFTGWMIIPLIFALRTDKGFYYALHCMRYVFLLIFFSAGLWKIRGGGIFNMEEMSAILIRQHAPYITVAPGDWFSRCVYYLSNHNLLSYTLYLSATLAELIFVIGFFTKRFDKLLIGAFILFVVLDFALMRINYFAWSAFLGCLWFSTYKEPGREIAN